MDTAVHTFEPTPEPAPRPSASAPQLRTLLLTDLADSTGMIERLGDTPASELFRAHDRLVLQLQQQWRGRLIDRSDGLLLLFERPIDGLGFALDYTRGLLTLGKDHNLELRARAGLHVGEVLTWRNSAEAVSVGAKPLEVEGLAKPMAARLMAMARPGQILLSAVAEPLAHRAARELGERGQLLAWKSWGRWRFKGVPGAQEIFEVGEPDLAPLRTPPSTPKAWRDIPLWRRPAALAAELALLAVGVLGVWFITRPEPAIAFNQRDWVVVGDLRNLTGQSALDDSLEQAFRISLEQSRHVNVLSDLKARDTLQRMQRPTDTVLDRAVASEIALRDGARAVILPTVAEVGGRVRVSAEVIDPRTQTTVYAESAEGKGIDSVLDSIDDVTAALRGKLGEAVKSIEKDSMPLPQVTTKNLDALRAYALGQQAFAKGEHEAALGFYERATKLDSSFALAWMGQVRVLYYSSKAPATVVPLRRAQALRGRLAPREALYVDAFASDMDAPAETAGKWKELARLYPDFWPAQGNAANWLMQQNRFAEALPFGLRNINPHNEVRALGYDMLGRAYLGTGRYADAAKAFDRSIALGFVSTQRRRAAVEGAQRHFDKFDRLLSRADKHDRYLLLDLIAAAVDRAQWQQALAYTDDALAQTQGDAGWEGRVFLLPNAVANQLAGNKGKALAQGTAAIQAGLAALDEGFDADAVDDALLTLDAAQFLTRLGDKSAGARVLDALASHPGLMAHPTVAELTTVVRATSLTHAGKPEEALVLLRPLRSGHERYETRIALLEAALAAGDVALGLEQTRWLQTNRGVAYIQLGNGEAIKAANIADSNLAVLAEAELLARGGDHAAARAALVRFDSLWPVAALPDYLRARRDAAIEASN